MSSMKQSIDHYYQILEVPVGADRETIERAYREFVELYSPTSAGAYGLFSDKEREELLKKVEEAHDVLVRHFAGPQVTAPDQSARQKVQHVEKQFQARTSTAQATIEVGPSSTIDGGFFRSIRESLALGIEDIGKTTRVGVNYLRLIENDEFDKLPARVYVQGFVRLYLKKIAPAIVYRGTPSDDQDSLIEDLLQRFMSRYDALTGDGGA